MTASRYSSCFPTGTDLSNWQRLKGHSVAVYLQLLRHYDGQNNGRVFLSVRDAAALCGINKETAGGAFNQLEDEGLIDNMRRYGASRTQRLPAPRSFGLTRLERLVQAHPLKPPCADETAAKAAPPQDDADRGLSNPQLSRNLLLRLALFAQRLDLLGQPRVDNLSTHGNLPSSG
jgi:hypothetical protein